MNAKILTLAALVVAALVLMAPVPAQGQSCVDTYDCAAIGSSLCRINCGGLSNCAYVWARCLYGECDIDYDCVSTGGWGRSCSNDSTCGFGLCCRGGQCDACYYDFSQSPDGPSAAAAFFAEPEALIAALGRQ